MSFRITVLLLFFYYNYSPAEGCSCSEDFINIVDQRLDNNFTHSSAIYAAYSKYFCWATFVIRAYVPPGNDSNRIDIHTRNATGDLHGDHLVVIQNVTVFRNTENATVPNYIRTSGIYGTCGDYFKGDTFHLVLGSPRNDTIDTDVCSHNIRWNELPQSMIDDLDSGQFASLCESSLEDGKKG